MTEKTMQDEHGGFARRAMEAACAVLVAVTLVYAGFLACALPRGITEMLSEKYSTADSSPFNREELVSLAVATQDYTVRSHDLNALIAAETRANVSVMNDNRDRIPGAPNLPSNLASASPEQVMFALNHAGEQYVLNEDALAHLDDCHDVISSARFTLDIVALAALAACVIVGARHGSRSLGSALMSAAGIVVGAFTVIAIWIAVDFYGFFTAFHSLFFQAGTWTFSWDSLLICMYPEKFWIGMGEVWLCATVSACILCTIIGIVARSIRPRDVSATR